MSPSDRALNTTLAGVAVVAIVGMFSGSNEPILDVFENTMAEKVLTTLHTGNEIIFGLSLGYLVSLFFWFLVVHMPESRKRTILKNNLAIRYQDFKEEVIRILLSALGGSHDPELPKRLSDYRRFKEFFSEHEDYKWYCALNGLQADKGRLNDLVVEIELLAKDIEYILNNVAIDDEEVHSFFKGLSTHVYKLKNLSVFTADHVKYLGNFIWGILAQWSFSDGQRKDDIVQKMIDKL